MNNQRIEELLAELKAAAVHGPTSVKAWRDTLSEEDLTLLDQEMLARVKAFVDNQVFLVVIVKAPIEHTKGWQRQEYAEMGYPYGTSPAGFMLWCRHRKLGIAPVHSLDEADIYVSLDELMTSWQPLWERE